MHSIHRYTWKSLQFFIIVIMIGNIHACVLKTCISSKYSKCISAIKRIPYTTAMHISSSSFVYFCFSLYYDACLKSSVLCVGVKTLHNTMCVKQLVVHVWFSMPEKYICFMFLRSLGTDLYDSLTLAIVNTLASICNRGFLRKKHRNAHGFGRKFLWSGKRY